MHKYIKILFKFAVSREYIKESPVDKVETPKEGVEEGEIKTYTPDELDRFEAKFSSTNPYLLLKLAGTWV